MKGWWQMGIVIKDTNRKKSYRLKEIRNKAIHGDALKVLKKIRAGTFEMAFIDPPYFLQLPRKELRRWNVRTKVDAVDDEWDKFSSFEEYDAFITRILSGVRRALKPNGTVWVISTYHSVHRIGRIMQDLGFWILNDVVWLKNNPMPNWLGVRFTNATETLLWAVRDKKEKKYTFDKNYAKSAGVGKVGANLWVVPLCSGEERMKGRKGGKLHSTQKPVELMKRVIMTSTREGDTILDPMAGVGTTGFVARALKRNFVMIELEKKYIDGIERRFKKRPRIDPEPTVDSAKAADYLTG